MSVRTEVCALRWVYQVRFFLSAMNLSSKTSQAFDASRADCQYLLLLALPARLHRIGPEGAHIVHFLSESPICKSLGIQSIYVSDSEFGANRYPTAG